jgi:hypothetical protein
MDRGVVSHSGGFCSLSLSLYTGESKVKWTTKLHYEDPTMQGSKMHIKFEIFEFFFSKKVVYVLFYKVKQFFGKNYLQMNLYMSIQFEKVAQIEKEFGDNQESLQEIG